MSLMQKIRDSKIANGIVNLAKLELALTGTQIAADAIDDYVNAHPTSGYEIQLAEQEGTYPIISDIADILGTKEAIAQGPSVQDLLPQSVINYFDGGVYLDDSNFPEERWNFGGVLCHDDNDLAPVFDRNTELYQMIGRHIEEQYRADQIVGIGFRPSNTREISVTFKIGNDYVFGFKKLEPGMMDAILRYNKP